MDSVSPEFEFMPEECFEFLEALYDLANTDDLCRVSLQRYLVSDLSMTTNVADLSLYFHFKYDPLI